MKADEAPIDAVPTFKNVEKDDGDNGKGTVIDPRSILRMRVERVEVLWSELHFE